LFEEQFAWKSINIGGYIEILEKCRKNSTDEFIVYEVFCKEISEVNEVWAKELQDDESVTFKCL
jgi:hypothetical protein